MRQRRVTDSEGDESGNGEHDGRQQQRRAQRLARAVPQSGDAGGDIAEHEQRHAVIEELPEQAVERDGDADGQRQARPLHRQSEGGAEHKAGDKPLQQEKTIFSAHGRDLFAHKRLSFLYFHTFGIFVHFYYI